MELMNSDDGADQTAAGGAGAGAGAGVPSGDAGINYVQVSQEEKDAIDRLQDLGFDRSVVVQAYFACDKDEVLTANYLFVRISQPSFPDSGQ